MTAPRRRRPAKLRRAVTYLGTLEWEYVERLMQANGTNVSQTIADVINDARIHEMAWQDELAAIHAEDREGA